MGEGSVCASVQNMGGGGGGRKKAGGGGGGGYDSQTEFDYL